MKYQHRVDVRSWIDVWTGWQHIEDALSGIAKSDHAGWDQDISCFLDRLRQAWNAAERDGEMEEPEGFRHRPLVTGTPGGDDGHAGLMFAFKMDANGTVILVEEVGYA